MKTNCILTLSALMFAVCLLAGCNHTPTAAKQRDNFPGNGNCYVMGKKLSKELSVEGQQLTRMPNGALKVSTLIRNRTHGIKTIQCGTTYKSGNFPVQDGGWQTLSIPPLETKTHEAISTRTDVETATVNIRSAQ